MVWLTKRCIAKIILRDPHHSESLACCQQDLDLCRTWLQALLDKLCSSDNHHTTIPLSVDMYPTLVRVYSITLTIPITSCSAEHSFSTLKSVKTRLCSSMLQDRLEGLMLMSIENKILIWELIKKNWLTCLEKFQGIVEDYF